MIQNALGRGTSFWRVSGGLGAIRDSELTGVALWLGIGTIEMSEPGLAPVLCLGRAPFPAVLIELWLPSPSLTLGGHGVLKDVSTGPTHVAFIADGGAWLPTPAQCPWL